MTENRQGHEQDRYTGRDRKMTDILTETGKRQVYTQGQKKYIYTEKDRNNTGIQAGIAT